MRPSFLDVAGGGFPDEFRRCRLGADPAAVAALPPGKRGVEFWISCLVAGATSQDAARPEVFSAFGSAALPRLLPLLQHDQVDVRLRALAAIAFLDPERVSQGVHSIALALGKAMAKDRDPRARKRALELLSKLGPFAGRALPAVVEVLRAIPAQGATEEEEQELWDLSASLVNLVAAVRPPASAELEQLLRHPNSDVVYHAISSLSSYREL